MYARCYIRKLFHIKNHTRHIILNGRTNFITKILIPSQKKRKIIDKDTTITSIDNFVITEGYPKPTNLDETIVNTLSISENYPLLLSRESSAPVQGDVPRFLGVLVDSMSKFSKCLEGGLTSKHC